MNHNFREDLPQQQPAATSRRSGDYFCIHSYAGEAGPPCGWRGRITEIPREDSSIRRCPRCGRATLLEIPAAGTDR